MGILDFVKQGVQEMLIQRPDPMKEFIVYKHPEETIPHFSQLTVDSDEAVVFFRDGAFVGKLHTAGAGQRHTLSSQNIPFLSNLVDSVTGGNIFLTDLFFVTTKPIFNIRFGGELGYIDDPMLGEMITPRIFGDMAIQIEDPARFIVNYMGIRAPTGNEEILKWIVGKFMNAVTAVVGEVMEAEQKSMLQMMRLQQQLAQVFLERCPDLNEIGVKVVDVGQFKINLDEADQDRLREAQAEIGKAKRAAKVAQIGIAQAQSEASQRQFELDQDFTQDSRYVQGLAGGDFGKYAAGKAMIGAGEGMAQGGGEGGGGGGAAGGMMAGAGLGAGFGMAQAFAGAMAPGAPAAAAAPVAAAAAVGGAAAGGGAVACPGCSAQVAPGKFCANCGTSLAPSPKFCPSCGTQGTPASKFCANCGTGYGA